MKQIEIVTPYNVHSSPEASQAPIALISHSKRYILMEKEVAKERGLNLSHPGTEPMDRERFRSHFDQLGTSIDHASTGKIFRRAALRKDDEIQEARISISHDGVYATAVCIAVDAGEPLYPDFTIDTGAGPPLHRLTDSDRKQDLNVDMAEYNNGNSASSTIAATVLPPDISEPEHGVEAIPEGVKDVKEEKPPKGHTKEHPLESNEAPDGRTNAIEYDTESPKKETKERVVLLVDAFSRDMMPSSKLWNHEHPPIHIDQDKRSRSDEDEEKPTQKSNKATEVRSEHPEDPFFREEEPPHVHIGTTLPFLDLYADEPKRRKKRAKAELHAQGETHPSQTPKVDQEEERLESAKNPEETSGVTKKRGRGRPKKIAEEQQ